MFGSIGPAELILIFVIALLVFGPKKLPEIGRSVGKAMREFKKTSEEIKGRIEEEIEASEIKDIRKDIQAGVDDLRSGMKALTADVPVLPDETKKDDAAKKDEEIKKDTEKHENGEGPKIS
ncbi:MAG: tatAd 2 [Candidatus Aminicenantes bacterium]|jgi:TatA/E family protein of Tat protein translocase|nr:tatAd 2 [Candidatus Aminicenantes bacterium]